MRLILGILSIIAAWLFDIPLGFAIAMTIIASITLLCWFVDNFTSGGDYDD